MCKLKGFTPLEIKIPGRKKKVEDFPKDTGKQTSGNDTGVF